MRRRLLILSLFAAILTTSAQQLSPSLQLEGALSIYRATTFLLENQRQNGSWQDSPELTALATNTLQVSAKLDEPKIATAIAVAIAFLKSNVPQGNDWRRAIVARPFLIEAKRDLPHKRFAEKLLETLAKKNNDFPPEAFPWIMDASLQANTTTFPFPQDQLDKLPGPIRFSIEFTTQPPPTRDQLQNARNATRLLNWSITPLEQTYWAARALHAWDVAFAPANDSWQADILNALLMRQAGNGAWNAETQYETAKNTAIAILTEILCLQ